MKPAKWWLLRGCVCYLFFSAVSVAAQDTQPEYFTRDMVKTTMDNDAYFYRKIKREAKTGYTIYEYYMNGRIKMKGKVETENGNKKTGYFIYYYENGQKSLEGRYVDDKEEGVWKSWYENGTRDYVARMKNGVLDGKGTWYYTNGRKSARELFANGQKVKGRYWTEQGRKMKEAVPDEVLPSFPLDSADGLNRYLAEKTIYPQLARSLDIEGRVVVNFCVNTDGAISNATVIRSAHPILDQEAVRVTTNMPKWKPGHAHNRPIKVYFALPFNFDIE